MTPGNDMTLAFALEALGRLADPDDAVRDARRWAAHVGVVSDEAPGRARAVADRVGVAPDFTGSVTGEADGLAVVRRQYPADRHVFVGTAAADEEAAGRLGWEYLDVAESARAAGWSLAESDGRWRAERDQEAGGER